MWHHWNALLKLLLLKQGKSEGFHSCDRPSNLTQIGFKSSIFQPLWPWSLMNNLEKQWGSSSILRQALCIISNPSVNSNWICSLETHNLGQNCQFFLSRVTLKFDGRPWKTKGQLFYAGSSFVHHFKAIGEFKLELQSGNAKYGSKSAIFFHCDLEIWWKTLKNNREHLLYYFKLCASLQSHRWIQTGVTVRKRPIPVKIADFFVPCDLEIWWMTLKTIGHLFYAASSFVHHFMAITEFKLE